MPALTASLAVELGPVRVDLVAPGFVDTPLSAALLGDGLQARREELRTTLPIATRRSSLRPLMLAEDLDASSTALAVGYEGPSRFSREYRRWFGAAPAADAARLRRDARGRAA